MGPFDKKVNAEGRRKPQRKAFTPSLGSFAESPQEEELGKEEQKRAEEQEKKPKVPKYSTGGLGFSQVRISKSKKPGLSTIQEADEGKQQRPDSTPSRKNQNQTKKR